MAKGCSQAVLAVELHLLSYPGILPPSEATDPPANPGDRMMELGWCLQLGEVNKGDNEG